jgi:hypothetical protein
MRVQCAPNGCQPIYVGARHHKPDVPNIVQIDPPVPSRASRPSCARRRALGSDSRRFNIALE